MDKTIALDALSALAHETRLDVFRLLVQAGPTGLAAGTIGETLDVRQNTMSSHLGILTRAGLVGKVRDGRVINYHANYDAMRALLLYLLEDCCGGDAAICSPVLSTCSKLLDTSFDGPGSLPLNSRERDRGGE
jgi:DNA-binding transcriptional ArsR family regulator